MGRCLGILFFTAFAACSTPKISTPPNTVLPSASAVYPSPNARLYITIRHAKRPFTVALIERGSGQTLGVASSSAILSEDGARLQGEVRATYSDDLSTVVVHEDFSDASPNPRYILFQREPGSVRYRTSYFAPPTAHTDKPGEFDFLCPNIQHVTSDAVTLEYGAPIRTRDVRVSDLPKTSNPSSFESFPN